MNTATHPLLAARVERYRVAMLNRKPDRVPIRPFAAEFAGKYAGYNCQQITHDYELGHAAVCKCAMDFDWDATVGNMVYVWTGLTDAIGLRYYAVPGIHIPPNVGFQYLEPPEDNANMRADEYDALIADPTGFLLNRWLPRVTKDVAAPGRPSTAGGYLSFLKGGMAMLQYFGALGAQNERLRTECGVAPAIGGILKAPLDILGDKLRGYYGLTQDLLEQPEKVLRACRALMPHLCHVALTSADPERGVPITIWLHRGCVPFITPEQFETVFWPTLRPILDSLCSHGYQVLIYAEGNWDAHLEAFAELPASSVIFHIDRSDLEKAHRALGHKFCLSGGLPNTLLARGSRQQVRDACKRIIDVAAADGGYIMDASAIIQNDADIDNVREMTDFTREYGVYGGGGAARSGAVEALRPSTTPLTLTAESGPPPGMCSAWDVKRKELGAIPGDESLVRRVWENIEGLAYTYLWHCLVSF